jgi:hypothetical protein
VKLPAGGGGGMSALKGRMIVFPQESAAALRAAAAERATGAGSGGGRLVLPRPDGLADMMSVRKALPRTPLGFPPKASTRHT